MPPQRRLTRSTSDKMIFGVAGGMATYFGIDPTLVRVLWVVAVFVGGFGLLAYILLGLVIPRDDTVEDLPADDAVKIAEERFARGELTSDELRSIRETLRNSGS